MLPNYEGPADYQLDAHLGLETPITRPLDLKFTINDLYNSRPPQTFQRNDLNAVTSLVWKF